MSTGQAAGGSWAIGPEWKAPFLQSILCPLAQVRPLYLCPLEVSLVDRPSEGREIQGLQCCRGCGIHPFHLPWFSMCPLLNKKKSFAAGKSTSNWHALALVFVLFLFLFSVRWWSRRVCVLLSYGWALGHFCSISSQASKALWHELGLDM